MKNLILAALAASFLAMGCAEPMTKASKEGAEEGEVLTGSRIPRKSAGNAESTSVVSGAGCKADQMNRSGDGHGHEGQLARKRDHVVDVELDADLLADRVVMVRGDQRSQFRSENRCPRVSDSAVPWRGAPAS